MHKIHDQQTLYILCIHLALSIVRAMADPGGPCPKPKRPCPATPHENNVPKDDKARQCASPHDTDNMRIFLNALA